jgi:pimeloyl-ACP methyl ester carboxylesterase
MREERWTFRGLPFGGLSWGEPTGVPTVLLHGFLDHAGSWARVAAGLPGFLVAPDLRGHGHSAWVGPGETYHFPEYLADLDALVDHLGGRVSLVGHSMGGTLASIYAGARPGAVERLAAVDGLGLPDGGAQARDRMVQFLDGVRRTDTPSTRTTPPMPTLAVAADRLRRAWPGLDDPFALALAERGARPVEGGFAWRYDPRHRIRSAAPYRQDHHRQFLDAITCPVLSIHPERSPFAPADVDRLESAIRDLRVEILPNAGHMAQLDAPDALAMRLRAFLG